MRVHSRPKKPVLEGSSKLPDILADKKQERRHLAVVEVFSKMYYKSHVSDLVKAACQNSDDDKKPVDVIRRESLAAWQRMQDDEPEKAEGVLEEYRRRKEDWEKDHGQLKPEPTPDEIAT